MSQTEQEPAADAGSRAMAAIKDFVIVQAKHEQISAEYRSARAALLSLLPKEIGQHELEEGGFKVTIVYPEKLVWDAAQLDALYGGDKPPYVKTAYRIDATALRTLPQSEREQLARCHSSEAGTPSIKIEKVS